MNIGLLDIDGHNFPNLALMKIARHWRDRGVSVEWMNFFTEYDIVYKSKVFTFTPDNMYHINAWQIYSGGTGYTENNTLRDDIDELCPDYSIYPMYKSAYGFLTRGCPNKCEWCIVPQKEGNIRAYADIEEFLDGRNSAILMDNNVLSHKHGIDQIEKIIKLGIKIDFNQGLDARLIDRPMAKLLSKVKWLSPLRMACDTDNAIKSVKRATKYLREYKCTPSNYFVYLLVKDIDSALMRALKLKELKLDPFAQPYIDFSGKNKVTQEQKNFARWVNHKAIFKSVKWENYK